MKDEVVSIFQKINTMILDRYLTTYMLTTTRKCNPIHKWFTVITNSYQGNDLYTAQTTFNDVSVISWWSVLLVEKTRRKHVIIFNSLMENPKLLGLLLHMCNLCLSPLQLWVQIPFMVRCSRYKIANIMSVNEMVLKTRSKH
jgi:hypothetical protein